ncbi:hypothetical protein Zmor_023387 [Zophobas morio]|uniref:Uncharacterized protein n=1 Tax=Zophobas morio TaxID=2755281 RepID=A0AA38HZB0_9CUCU|nr:hypothetical protein Zmor_023387 [Zophobas morio]
MYRNYSGALDCLHWMKIHYLRSPLFKLIFFDRDPSRTSIATPLRDSPGRCFETAPDLSLCARLSAVNSDDSPISAVRTSRRLSTAIGVVLGRRKGVFRNNSK